MNLLLVRRGLASVPAKLARYPLSCAPHTRLSSSSTSEAGKDRPDLQILDHALTKVKQFGWTEMALSSAASDLGLSTMAHTVAPRGGLSLVQHFMDRALDETRIEVDDQLHEFDSSIDKLRFLCRTRLKQTRPYAERWPEAAAILAQPQNIPVALHALSELSSAMWYLADDQSVRLDWYAKRSALAALYVSAELYMCEDTSPEFAATWQFLDRRINDLYGAERASNWTISFANQFSRNFVNILASRGYIGGS
ncbi:Ubiquinone biosynthesis protein coq9, mitochondrial [Coemansia sp. RSA 989]|nr:COQ9-domain-containing protein [Coemansia mojavensis]KAJ1744453.1 Ubiquinone biosynthesis protein coq9, mitochondrial [Coemansia sp. RSA 1086]KAJ1753685.1 Ubiquinone biosynthesis protein coq9, mitochondrial [Coemansia sp. RSA 1821]KAJ1868494.1 Ubiquinone biosynthesis protein coq9, mitochondrial [Coemansia sp. RSA 989]KAJ1876104.1 Ubiquinone biosynthesis protein coq9, mitochondrial [Coemansia sp. RSA 990]KAJ2629656.1 Ubiquinone biosynthesis protein coq9, mitochondrial [Coemansia sp. RSA 1290